MAQVKVLPSQANIQAESQRRFSPYVSNGGSVVAVAGKDFAVIAGDTRLSFGYSISSRDVPKTHQLTPHCVIGSGGMQAEASTLWKVLDARLTWYEHQHQKTMGVSSVAQMLSTILYHKRFFPYYTFNLVAGVDEKGQGLVYGYDAVGSYESMPYGVTGTGSALITSLLDNQVGFLTQKKNKKDLSLEETVALVKDCFTVCGERDINTGDAVQICIITKDGVQTESFQLKKD